MKKFLLISLAIIMVASMAGISAASTFNAVVGTDWLSEHLGDPNLVVIDIRAVADYKASHIPGAVNVLYGSLSVKKGTLANEVPDLEDLQDLLQEAGINSDSTVVIYSAKYSKADSFAGIYDSLRIYFTLKYAGVAKVGLLDGGLDKWLAEKKGVTAAPTTVKMGNFEVKPNESIMATREEVLAAALGGSPLIVSVLDAATFGAKHIKGSVNLPSASVFNDNGTLKTAMELSLLAVPVVGADLEKPIITHCVSGRTCNAWTFALLEMLGYKEVATYDGSSQDFPSLPTLPMVP